MVLTSFFSTTFTWFRPSRPFLAHPPETCDILWRQYHHLITDILRRQYHPITDHIAYQAHLTGRSDQCPRRLPWAAVGRPSLANPPGGNHISAAPSRPFYT